ncbi:MAG: hypothetical protein DCC75_04755 [Proteobacteria bacterium]|nr:MAG: hypothetical protein DCC75_04755 [Pseudomonadota bacterium]
MASRIIRVVILVLVLGCCYGFVERAFQILPYQYCLNIEEGVVLYAAQLLIERGSYFFDINQPPYFHASHAPIYIIASAILGELFGQTLLAARAVTTISFLLCTVLIYRVLRLQGADRLLAAICSLMFPAAWFVQSWGSVALPDSLALALTLFGIYLHLKPGAGSLRLLSLAALVAAVFTKQSYISGLLAVGLAGSLGNDDRRGLGPILVFVVGLVGFTGGILQLYTNGEFLKHLLEYGSPAPFLPSRAAVSYLAFVKDSFALLILILIALLITRRSNLSGPHPLLLIYWLLTILGLAGMGKESANSSDYFEAYAATLIMTGVSIVRLSSISSRIEEFWFSNLALLIFVAGMYSNQAPKLPEYVTDKNLASPVAEIVAEIQQTPGIVLSEDLGLPLKAGAQPEIGQSLQLAQLQLLGKWDPAALIERCDRKEFQLIIVEWRLLSVEGIAACLEKNYLLKKKIGDFSLYHPAGKPPKNKHKPRKQPLKKEGTAGRPGAPSTLLDTPAYLS